jgi:hypothetical protein
MIDENYDYSSELYPLTDDQGIIIFKNNGGPTERYDLLLIDLWKKIRVVGDRSPAAT